MDYAQQLERIEEKKSKERMAVKKTRCGPRSTGKRKDGDQQEGYGPGTVR